MKLSSLRERVTIQKRSFQADQHGGYQLIWHDEKDLWVEIKATSGPKGNNEESVYSRVYQIRWRAAEDVTYLSQLKWGSCLMRFITRPQKDVYKRWTSAFAKIIEGAENE